MIRKSVFIKYLTINLTIITIFVLNFVQPLQAFVLGVSEDIFISARVAGCILDLKIYPERRLPITDNWQTDLEVEIYQGNVFIGSFTTTTNYTGNSIVNLCSKGFFLEGGTYSFYIKGQSHLRQLYKDINSFGTYETFLDFSSENPLIAGDTSIIVDNKVNLFDVSIFLYMYNSVDFKSDLNQDGVVNALDLSTLLINYNKQGD